jgi:hypothetical protein
MFIIKSELFLFNFKKIFKSQNDFLSIFELNSF